MNRPSKLRVPARSSFLVIIVAGLGGCLSGPDLDAPAVVPAGQSPQRTAAVAEMREQATAGEALSFPDVFQREQTIRLAARAEPRPVASVEAIEAELAAIARREQAAVTPAEIAALKARAAELRRLAAAAQAGAPRL
jgi:hypothetical protein